ncbi:MAG: DUF547 domain-containing protein, partial [Bacteroidota bacterium]
QNDGQYIRIIQAIGFTTLRTKWIKVQQIKNTSKINEEYKADGRIHFALNCGAKSCPYIAVYDAIYMDEQLDEIAHQFLNRTSTYEPENEEVYVTSLFSWFRGDFGGKSGIRDYLRKYEVIPQEADPSLSFETYDWTLELGNYTDLSAGKTVSK